MFRCALLAALLVEGLAEDVLSNAKLASFEWGAAERTVLESLEDAFPESDYPDGFWSNLKYTHSSMPQITAERIAGWVKELITGPSPFPDAKVPVPLMNDQNHTPGLDELQYVAYTRRQVCYIVAKSLVGSKTLKFQNGLTAFLDREGSFDCLPRKGGFGRSFWTLLASCYADPTLINGQGPRIVISRGSQQVGNEELLQGASLGYPLSSAKLKVCRYDGSGSGSEGSGKSSLPGMTPVDASRCAGGADAVDFMSAHGPAGQAMQVMTQGHLGGKLFGVQCNFGGGQSEHVAFVMPELTALSFFLSDAGQANPQLHTPIWVLGARPLFDLQDGTFWSAPYAKPYAGVPFSSDVVEVQIGDQTIQVSNLKPVVAFSAETESTLGASLSREEIKLARTNRLGKQRDSSKKGTLSFARKVQMYYRGMSLAHHSPDMAPMLKKLVHSVGVGPWGAGLSFGDSTLAFLAMWIGHAAAAGTWDGEIPALEYYIYSSFLENPSNQCLVLSNNNCRKCISHCKEKTPPKFYWLPQEAFLEGNNPCLTGEWHECSMHGIEHVHWNYKDRSAGRLWQMVAYALWMNRRKSDRSIMDELMEMALSEAREQLTPIFPKQEVYT